MKLLTITFYELKRIWRNPRLVVLVLSQPIVIALIIGLLANHDFRDIQVGIINKEHNQYSDQIETKLKESNVLKVSQYQDADQNEIKNGKLMGFIILNIDNTGEGSAEIQFNPVGRFIKSVIIEELSKASNEASKDIVKNNLENQINKNLAGLPINTIEISASKLEPIIIKGEDASPFDLKFFDYYSSAMMVLLILLVVTNLSGSSITGERVAGTFERLFVTPYSKIDVVLGKALAQFLIGIFVGVVGIASMSLMFNITLGNIWLLILLYSLVVASAVTLGLLISVVTYTVVESVQLAMYVFFISVLTTSIFSPTEVTWKYFPYFMKMNPFYYAVDASRRINMLDAQWQHISTNIYIIAGFFIGFLVLAVVLLRRETR